jgi:hypothetical protein
VIFQFSVLAIWINHSIINPSPFPKESIVVKEKKTSREAKKAPAKSMKEKRAAKAAKKG